MPNRQRLLTIAHALDGCDHQPFVRLKLANTTLRQFREGLNTLKKYLEEK